MFDGRGLGACPWWRKDAALPVGACAPCQWVPSGSGQAAGLLHRASGPHARRAGPGPRLARAGPSLAGPGPPRPGLAGGQRDFKLPVAPGPAGAQ
jgi:hypothetical protein